MTNILIALYTALAVLLGAVHGTPAQKEAALVTSNERLNYVQVELQKLAATESSSQGQASTVPSSPTPSISTGSSVDSSVQATSTVVAVPSCTLSAYPTQEGVDTRTSAYIQIDWSSQNITWGPGSTATLFGTNSNSGTYDEVFGHLTTPSGTKTHVAQSPGYKIMFNDPVAGTIVCSTVTDKNVR